MQPIEMGYTKLLYWLVDGKLQRLHSAVVFGTNVRTGGMCSAVVLDG